jgi:hypothetical protein
LEWSVRENFQQFVFDIGPLKVVKATTHARNSKAINFIFQAESMHAMQTSQEVFDELVGVVSNFVVAFVFGDNVPTLCRGQESSRGNQGKWA